MWRSCACLWKLRRQNSIPAMRLWERKSSPYCFVWADITSLQMAGTSASMATPNTEQRWIHLSGNILPIATPRAGAAYLAAAMEVVVAVADMVVGMYRPPHRGGGEGSHYACPRVWGGGGAAEKLAGTPLPSSSSPSSLSSMRRGWTR